MIQLSTGNKLDHSVYGEIEIYGFVSVGDEIEINNVNRDGEQILDVVTKVNDDKVEFLDDKGRKHVEPLETFYEHANLDSE